MTRRLPGALIIGGISIACLLTIAVSAQRGQQTPPQTPPAGQGGQGAGAGAARQGGGGGQRGGRGNATITIKAARVLDGRGNMLKDATITVQGTKIVSIGTEAGPNPATYDLGDVTV